MVLNEEMADMWLVEDAQSVNEIVRVGDKGRQGQSSSATGQYGAHDVCGACDCIAVNRCEEEACDVVDCAMVASTWS